MLCASPGWAQRVGEVGVAAYGTRAIVRGDSAWSAALPYGYFDYDRFFMRVDTLGLKTLKMGQGYLELAGRVSFEGFTGNAALPGVRNRPNPIPLGLGTFQEFDWGGVFLNAFYNVQGARGMLLEATYAAELKAGPVTLYPTVGVEHRSAAYVRGLYGVDAVEASALGSKPYAPGASTMPVLGLGASMPLNDSWGLSLQWRRRWLDDAVRSSPLVNRSTQDTAYLALTYRFK
jgi:outer membrane protein